MVGIHPREATRGVTAASPGAAIVPVGRQTRRAVSDGEGSGAGLRVSGPSCFPVQSLTSDEMHARALQAEEHEAAYQIAVALAADARLALELSESDSPALSYPNSPNSVHAPPSPSINSTLPSRGVFATGNRFDVLSRDQDESEFVIPKMKSQRRLFAQDPVGPDRTASLILADEMAASEKGVMNVKEKETAHKTRDQASIEERRRLEAEEAAQSAVIAEQQRKADRASAARQTRVLARAKAYKAERERSAALAKRMSYAIRERETALSRKRSELEHENDLLRRRLERKGNRLLVNEGVGLVERPWQHTPSYRAEEEAVVAARSKFSAV